MIPKIIHYCWFGGAKQPKQVKKCIQSWKKYCPDYTIICWNEDNYDIGNACAFVKEAYRHHKWAFVSDYVRLDVVYRMGGVYLDTDVELLKPLKSVVKGTEGFWGFENAREIASGIGFAAVAGEAVLQEMLDCYQKLCFSEERMDRLKCPIINTAVLKRHGLVLNNTAQVLEGRIRILPTEYLCPENIFTGQVRYTEKTVSVHHYSASWQSGAQRWKNKCIITCKKILPKGFVAWVRRFFRNCK